MATPEQKIDFIKQILEEQKEQLKLLRVAIQSMNAVVSKSKEIHSGMILVENHQEKVKELLKEL